MATIFASRSSEALSSQCRSSNTRIIGVSRLRACTSRCSSSRVRKPISTPSSPSKAPSGGFEAEQIEQQAEIFLRAQAEALQTFVQLARHDGFTVAWRSRNAPRTISMKARNGVCWPSGVQLPVRTRARSLTICPRNSCTRRDLPMPGSPTMSKTWMPPPDRVEPALQFLQLASRPT